MINEIQVLARIRFASSHPSQKAVEKLVKRVEIALKEAGFDLVATPTGSIEAEASE